MRVGGAWTTFRVGGSRSWRPSRSTTTVDAAAGRAADDGGTVGTGTGALRLVEVQPEGRAPMAWHDFANGAHPEPGESLV